MQGRTVRHALHFQTASRWRANVWISSHVFLILAIGALGAGMGLLRQPWTSALPVIDRSSADAFHTRMLVCGPLTLILLLLCVQHGVHIGGGRGTRRIGRRCRLLCRAFVSLLILCLPFFVLFDPSGTLGY